MDTDTIRCPTCTFNNPAEAVKCNMCQSPLQSSESDVPSPSVPSVPPPEYTPTEEPPTLSMCEKCTFANPFGAEKCEVCGSALFQYPSEDPETTPETTLLQELQEQDQPTNFCGHCNFNNIPFINECEQCGFPLLKYAGANPDVTTEFQAKLMEVSGREEVIRKNKTDAFQEIPELLIPVDMIYIPCSVNGLETQAFVDTGCQVTIMSKEFAIKAGLEDFIDYKVITELRGVGKKNNVGKIWMGDIVIGGHSLPTSFTVMEDREMDIMFGLNMLLCHGASMDFKERTLTIRGVTIPFEKKKD